MANATRGIIFLVITVILIGFIIYQIQDNQMDIEKANQAVKDSTLAVELSKQRVAEAQARVDYYNTH